jgi:transcriptional regulator with XRE-family HTH domain
MAFLLRPILPRRARGGQNLDTMARVARPAVSNESTMSLSTDLLETLKARLKRHGMTYAQLAPRIGLSEAAVKRTFSKGTMTLGRLEEICDVLGIGLADLSQDLQSKGEPLSELSAEAEHELVGEPKLLLGLYLVLNRWKEQEVLAHYHFDKVEWTRVLARLDRMGVIDLLPDNQVKLRTARNFRWRAQGPIQKLFERKLLPEYFAQGFTGPHQKVRLLTGMMTAASAEHFERLLGDLSKAFDALLEHDAALPVASRIGISAVLAVRPWEIPMFKPMRNT